MDSLGATGAVPPVPPTSRKGKQPTAVDPRLEVGAAVHAEATNITSYMECTRLFGARATTKMVEGTVMQVIPGLTKAGRRKTDLLVRWMLPGRTVEKTLALRTVKKGPPPETTVTRDNSVVDGSPVTQESQAERAGGGCSSDTLTNAAALSTSQVTPPVRGSSAPSGPSRGNSDATVAPAPTGIPARVTAHGLDWSARPVSEPVGGPVPRHAWSVRTLSGEVIHEQGDAVGPGQSRLPYDYFMAMFPLDQLVRMVRLTSAKLAARNRPATTAGEVLKFLGVILLATRYEFGARADLWATQARNKYLPAPAFGERTGMPRARFDALWSCVTFSEQRSAGDTSEQGRWELITDFVSAINEHRAARVTPSESICVDESMSKWYGQGGHWIQRGLPMYVAIDRKPENGCELQNAACGRSGIMLRLRVVTTAEHQQAVAVEGGNSVPHGTSVLKALVAPWAGSKRIVCADSYFASVATATHLLAMGLRFIGVVKTATKSYPMAALSGVEVTRRGAHVSYAHTNADGVVDLMAVLWVDRERRYFIASTSTSSPGAPCERVRWRQVGDHAERVTLTVPQPEVAEVYYATCAQIDRHNRCRQDDLRLEHKLGTHDWSLRVNLTLLGMCLVDAWLLYSGARAGLAHLSQNAFYEDLAAQLIDNTFDTVGVRARGAARVAAGEASDGTVRYGVGVHLTPTNKRRAGKTAKDADHRAQRDCRVCKRHRSSLVCSSCRENARGEVFCCGPKTGRQCFEQHMREIHELDV